MSADSADVLTGFFNGITVLLVWPDTFSNLKDGGKCLFSLLYVVRTFFAFFRFCKSTHGTDNGEFSAHGIHKYFLCSPS